VKEIIMKMKKLISIWVVISMVMSLSLNVSAEKICPKFVEKLANTKADDLIRVDVALYSVPESGVFRVDIEEFVRERRAEYPQRFSGDNRVDV
jgi:hypothetical protein